MTAETKLKLRFFVPCRYRTRAKCPAELTKKAILFPLVGKKEQKKTERCRFEGGAINCASDDNDLARMERSDAPHLFPLEADKEKKK